MASQSGEHNELNFTGESAEEAEDFVQAVHRRAYAAGRPRDNTWMAEFAFPCFSRKALRWYETLDEETQIDWKLLKRAILAEFCTRQPGPATVPSTAPALATSSSNPTPAAPPPPVVTVKIGRIRVDSEDKTKRGYLWINTANRDLGTVVSESSKANTFDVDTLGRTLKFQRSEDALAIQGYSTFSLSPRTSGFGCMMKSSTNLGTQWNYTWNIAEDGTITATLLRTDGSHYDAAFLVYPIFVDSVIHVPADKEAFLGTYRSINCVVTLHLEPLA